MKVKVLNEAGYDEAMLGLSLSYRQPVENMPRVALALLLRGGSHTKFLESIVVWLDITAPRFWWQQFDTYRIGVSKQSESTMHTLLQRPLLQGDFESPIPLDVMRCLNRMRTQGRLEGLKSCLPEGFLQRRIVCLSYKVLARTYGQRKDHRLPQWRTFLNAILEGVTFPEFVVQAPGEA